MKSCIFSSYSTYSTTFAVKYSTFFNKVIIKKITYLTKVPSKLNFTVFAIFLRKLNMVTIQAFNLFDCVSIDLMIFVWIFFLMIRNIIMTKSTRKELLTLQTSQLTSSTIMGAPKFRVKCLFLFFNLLFLI